MRSKQHFSEAFFCLYCKLVHVYCKLSGMWSEEPLVEIFFLHSRIIEQTCNTQNKANEMKQNGLQMEYISTIHREKSLGTFCIAKLLSQNHSQCPTATGKFRWTRAAETKQPKSNLKQVLKIYAKRLFFHLVILVFVCNYVLSAKVMYF